jgi:(p)ppGpp synthase/HD superfamily hydrolase
MATVLSNRFDQALTLASWLHRNDRRKGTSIPYLAHLLGVCDLVLTDGGNEDEAIAALLHDAPEDHADQITREDLEARFGSRVRSHCRRMHRYAGGLPRRPKTRVA